MVYSKGKVNEKSINYNCSCLVFSSFFIFLCQGDSCVKLLL